MSREPHIPENTPTATAALPPLFVDLDGTLIASDVLWESTLLSIKRSPQTALHMPLWLLKGKAELKHRIALCAQCDVQLLPYHDEVLQLLKREKARGRQLILATASHRLLAEKVAQHLNIFDDILASDAQQNLRSGQKLAAIEAWCREHGHTQFAYLGDSTADLAIWQATPEALAVNPSTRVRAQLAQRQIAAQIITTPRNLWRAIWRVMRPQQWAKNLLLFLPLILAHKLGDFSRWSEVLLAFVAFSAAASSVYVLNDLLDIEADRRHPKKRRRPFAAGSLPVSWGVPLAGGLLCLGLMVAAFVGLDFFALLCVYLTLTTLYSFWLKRIAIVDVIVLAGLYTLRILAGGEAANVVVSQWMLMLSMFLFLSLALAKRYAELSRLVQQGDGRAHGRGYLVEDLALISSLGPTSGYMAVLVLGLYINGDASWQLYPRSWVLWLACPLLLYWVSRLWLLAKRRQLDEDPLVFALKDRASLLIGVLVALLGILAATG